METKKFGNWGKITEVKDTTAITQTNSNEIVGTEAYIHACPPRLMLKSEINSKQIEISLDLHSVGMVKLIKQNGKNMLLFILKSNS